MDQPILLTQQEAAKALGVSSRYLRDSSCPKVLLPGTGPTGKPLVRYAPGALCAWAASWASDKHSS